MKKTWGKENCPNVPRNSRHWILHPLGIVIYTSGTWAAMQPDLAKKEEILERPAGGSGAPYGPRLTPSHEVPQTQWKPGRKPWPHGPRRTLRPPLTALHLRFQWGRQLQALRCGGLWFKMRHQALSVVTLGMIGPDFLVFWSLIPIAWVNHP